MHGGIALASMLDVEQRPVMLIIGLSKVISVRRALWRLHTRAVPLSCCVVIFGQQYTTATIPIQASESSQVVFQWWRGLAIFWRQDFWVCNRTVR